MSASEGTSSYRRTALAAVVLASMLVGSGEQGAAAGDLSGDEARVGRVEARIVSGQRFESREGRDKITLNFNRDGSLEADVLGLGEFAGMWWVDPAGRLCLVADYWAGGACFEALIDQAGKLIGVREAGGGSTIEIKPKGASR